jgi:uncharacterized membrane protein (UPF0127 family)
LATRSEHETTETALRDAGGQVVCEHCQLAETVLARTRGLLGRRYLPLGEGLLLHPANSIHTAFMHFPIDAVFLDREGVVVGIARELKPWRVAARRHARSVLELPAGACRQSGLSVGARVLLPYE